MESLSLELEGKCWKKDFTFLWFCYASQIIFSYCQANINSDAQYPGRRWAPGISLVSESLVVRPGNVAIMWQCCHVWNFAWNWLVGSKNQDSVWSLKWCRYSDNRAPLELHQCHCQGSNTFIHHKDTLRLETQFNFYNIAALMMNNILI